MATLASKFWVVKPAALDSKRDQNSVILLSKVRFPGGSLGEITELVKFPQGVKVPVAKVSGLFSNIHIRVVSRAPIYNTHTRTGRHPRHQDQGRAEC